MPIDYCFIEDYKMMSLNNNCIKNAFYMELFIIYCDFVKFIVRTFNLYLDIPGIELKLKWAEISRGIILWIGECFLGLYHVLHFDVELLLHIC